ncbi:hypothetical protein DH2020_046197 [Rehmannia glutinosa]|uniref:Protein TIFY n=1 Tax=Rehmannia glutinosa TaxID=99300 RepID=A0ABR0UC18_REHGL
MQPEGSAAKSALDKPLHQLTEDDIAQITREDCRRYLKEKGMRRPSWNKSQAIQQVIMLKTLLETTPDSDAGSRKRLRFSRPNNVPSNNNNNISENVPKGTRSDAEDSMSAGEMAPAPYSRKDLDKPDSSGGLSGRFLAVNNETTPSRSISLLSFFSFFFAFSISSKGGPFFLSRIKGLSSMPVGQMTIFYCGKVNVYDDMPEDKARSILNIAASSVQIPQEQPVDGNMMMQPLSCLSKTVSAKARLDSAVLLPTLQTVKMNDNSRMLGEESNILREETPTVEGPSNRKASVQRYLDKRKDRFKSKSKRKAGITSCASLDMYFNQQKDNQIPNEPLIRSNTCSPPQIRPSSTPNRCSSVVNDSLKDVSASTDPIN